ncbi:MAG TPA: superoxide dismutase [Candidatus Kapabacteria bacterium]|nr:superoxide dismutase [Candidatus Kapabacteria bacterium]
MTKREFLGAASILSASAMMPNITLANQKMRLFGLDKTIVNGEYILPQLPYGYSSLEPHIDAKTMELHYSKHHQGYVNGLNNAHKKIKEAIEKSDYALIKHWERELAFNGGGHFLHTIFWNVMGPKQGTRSKTLDDYINKSFGSFDNFKKLFTAAANAVEGSGWGIMHYEPVSDRLVVMQAERQGNLTQWITVPILPIDVWEHAYYLKYQNKRTDYIEAFFKVINWEYVSSQFDAVLSMYK